MTATNALGQGDNEDDRDKREDEGLEEHRLQVTTRPSGGRRQWNRRRAKISFRAGAQAGVPVGVGAWVSQGGIRVGDGLAVVFGSGVTPYCGHMLLSDPVLLAQASRRFSAKSPF